MELLISSVLRIGVIVSAGVIALGVIAFALTRDTGYARVLPHHLRDLLAFHQRRGPGYFPTNVVQVVEGALHLRPYAIIALGMALLVATPVVRVALSVAFFAAQRDWVYVVITLFVLGVLVVSLATGAG
ncbi:MAG TPA: DUF1634 domain-containing protein [Polyangia bacterium]|jgi:uncharacterized membrane protein